MFSKTNLMIFLAKNGLNQRELAEKMGISEASMSRKIRGITDFSLVEVGKFISVYGIENARDIFFADDVKLN